VLLLFRTLRVLLFGLLGRRHALLDESRLRLMVWPNDCDLNFHLNDGRYVSIGGLGRVDLLARMGLLRIGRKRGWFPVVGTALIRYRRSLMPFERFTLRTRTLAWDAKWVYMEHRFEGRDGSLAARLLIRALLRTKEGPVPTAELLAALGHEDVVSPPLPPEIAKWIEVDF
jgi:acyl-CoA thioesterase FadM